MANVKAAVFFDEAAALDRLTAHVAGNSDVRGFLSSQQVIKTDKDGVGVLRCIIRNAAGEVFSVERSGAVKQLTVGWRLPELTASVIPGYYYPYTRAS